MNERENMWADLPQRMLEIKDKRDVIFSNIEKLIKDQKIDKKDKEKDHE